jgi:rhodanese-related sulfurtransferase
MENLQDAIEDIKEALPNLTPTPPDLKSSSAPQDLKSRLEWGEPALTIVDVRDRETFNRLHINGAMPMPLPELADRAKAGLQLERDIYVYGSSEQETAQAAATLRESGFRNVAELQGGLEGWKAIDGAIDGSESMVEPGPDAYNVVSRVAHHKETQKADFKQAP